MHFSTPRHSLRPTAIESIFNNNDAPTPRSRLPVLHSPLGCSSSHLLRTDPWLRKFLARVPSPFVICTSRTAGARDRVWWEEHGGLLGNGEKKNK